MELVLTTASDVTCGHSPGKVAVASSAHLTVGGSAVLIASSIDLKAVSGCSTVPKSGPDGPTDITCTSASATPLPGPPSLPGVSGGKATKLTAGGQPVILETLAGKTNGMVGKTAPQSKLAATAKQSKLQAS